MKLLLLPILLFAAAGFAWAGEPPTSTTQPPPLIKGEVLEVKDVENYTYLRLKTNKGETWAAVGKTPVKKGATVTIEDVVVMNNFESKSLKKTFPSIIFGRLAGAGANITGSGGTPGMPHSGNGDKTDVTDIPVPRATGANARTVAEIITKAAEMKDQPVLVRGRVVKYNPGIMEKNWIHLRDGSGSAADNTHDILVTSVSTAKIGDVLTVKGIVRTDKNFGSGYAYKVLIEEATFQ